MAVWQGADAGIYSHGQKAGQYSAARPVVQFALWDFSLLFSGAC
jgi:hypothetical protein